MTNSHIKIVHLLSLCVFSLGVLKTQDVNSSRTFDSLLNQSTELIETNNFDVAMSILDQAELIIENRSDEKQYADILFNRGYAYDMNGLLDTALTFYNRAQKIYGDLDLNQSVAKCLNYKASAHFFTGDFEPAIEKYLECIDFSEKHDIKGYKIKALMNLGVTYRVTNKNKEALSVYHKTLSLAKELPDSNLVAATYHNIGVAYSFDSSYQEAIVYLDSAFTQYTYLNDSLEMARTSNAFGDAYFLEGKDLNKAKEYLLKSINLQGSEVQQDILANTYLALGRIEQRSKQYNQAENYFKKGLL